jgi:hypothetical protein
MEQLVIHYSDLVFSEPQRLIGLFILPKVDRLLELLAERPRSEGFFVYDWLLRLLNKLIKDSSYEIFILCSDRIKKYLTIEYLACLI